MDQPQSIPPVQNQKPTIHRSSRSLWWLAILVVAALGLSVWSWVSQDNANTNTSNDSSETQNASALQNANAALTFTYQGQDGKTALELLKAAYPNTTTKTSGSLGEYVTGINGVEAGNSAFWEFTVNGTPASVGAGAYTTTSAESIEWKLTSF